MTASPDYDVIIVGGGPVGLLLGVILGRKGLRALLIEKTSTAPAESMAIGVTPPSLELFQQLDLDQDFVSHGVRVDRAKVYEGKKLAGELSFHSLDNPYPFILAIPQATTVELLENRLAEEALVSLRRQTSLLKIDQTEQHVTATVQRDGAAKVEQITAAFLVGCDGHRSLVRDLAKISLQEEKKYPAHFLMADFADNTDLGNEAHLFFSRHGSIESFPLPDQKRRWIVQTDRLINPPDTDLLVKAVQRQTAYSLEGSKHYSKSVFSVRRFVCQSYHRNRVTLCGDAAHVMSPIGGQGMNTGFADAEFLADALGRIVSGGEDYHSLFASYDHYRRAAFNVAAARAERGMWFGTRCGRPASFLRFLFVKSLLSPFFSKPLPAYFAMLTIPYRSLKSLSDGQH